MEYCNSCTLKQYLKHHINISEETIIDILQKSTIIIKKIIIRKNLFILFDIKKFVINRLQTTL